MKPLSPEPIDPLANMRRMYPTYNESQLEQSRVQLHAYFDLAWDIFDRLEAEGIDYLGKPSPTTPQFQKKADEKPQWPAHYV